MPMWTPAKYQSGLGVFLVRALKARAWNYGGVMASNKRERSVYSDAVAATIKGERAAAGLHQRDMIERTGISRSTYIRIEAGTHVADTTEVARICAALGLGFADFFHRVELRL